MNWHNGKNGIYSGPHRDGGDGDPTQVQLINPLERAACLRTLIGFTNSGGRLTSEELAALEEAWDKLDLPSALTFQSVLSEQIDINKQLVLIVSEEGRERTYTATFLFAHSRGACSAKQQKLLALIHSTLQISVTMETPLSRIYGQVREQVFPALSRFIGNPVERTSRIDEAILKFSMSNAVTGAFPIRARAVATGVMIFATQAVMVSDLGKYWGFTISQQGAHELMANIQGNTSMHIAIQSLLREGAITESTHDCNPAFYTTWALGSVANTYFESGRRLEDDALRVHYATALKEAEVACEKNKVEIAAAAHSRSITLDILQEEFTVGNITSEEYDKKIMGLP